MFMISPSDLQIHKNPYQNSIAIWTEIEKKILKFICNHIRHQITKITLSKKNKAGGTTLSDFKIYYKVIIIKRAWYKHKTQTYKPVKQIRGPIKKKIINPCIYTQEICDKNVKKKQQKNDGLKNSVRKSEYPYAEEWTEIFISHHL